MDNFWVKVIKVTGYVGVIAFLFTLLMEYVFSESIIALLGSEKVFYIIVALLAIFTLCILIALLKPPHRDDNKAKNNHSQPTEHNKEKKDISVTYTGESTHNGNNLF
ncbi:hypothetical protein [Shewanella sp. Arc9-LZ]|uniref:hypothetical protein n=1 Tax=Shewanella sp. Arc9-LZ TaxID=2698686 RepID=UPI00137BCE92|nr:hypothetical protein [Shewanella sp. Arc9-LZ]QHS14662.1 hypothetical protein GUY17_16925 [Shewanella sp. Arc9-LZ]